MSVKIYNYSEDLKQRFNLEKSRLTKILEPSVKIEHIGSSAVGIGGKNIIDILIGVPDNLLMEDIKKILVNNGYFSGDDNHPDRLFLASKKEETGQNDIHIHICPLNSDTFHDFIILRNYLRSHPDVAHKYFEKKREIAILAQNDRKKYKQLKSSYVSLLLKEAKKEKK